MVLSLVGGTGLNLTAANRCALRPLVEPSGRGSNP